MERSFYEFIDILFALRRPESLGLLAFFCDWILCAFFASKINHFDATDTRSINLRLVQ